MQKTASISPKFLNLDSSVENLKPEESPHIRDLTWDENGNPKGSPIGRGQNEFSLTPVQSNQSLGFTAPAGYNKNIGYFYSETTQETYFLNYNKNGNHGIYVVYGNTRTVAQVIVDPELGFTDNQNGFMSNHRCSMRTFLDKTGRIVEKILLLTDGNTWQKWILVNASIQTSGFNPSLNPYWQLQPPHFDRRELLEWAIRPPMYKPLVATIPNTADDVNKINRIIDLAVQVAYVFQNTDGRRTVFSPYSNPLIVKSEDYLNDPDNLPKNALFTLYAGSPLTESISIYIRKNALNANSIPSITEWTDWYLYDTIYKFSDSETSESVVIDTPYWERTNPWSAYQYDAVFNTIRYPFDNSKVPQIIDQIDAARLQNDIPQLSVAMSDLGDAESLANNRRDYDNLSGSTISNMDVVVLEKPSMSCSIPTRKIRLYAYVGMCSDNFAYYSQVGYINGADTTVRFGSLRYGGTANVASFNVNESKAFALDFADKKALRVYLKGTPYFADGTWYQVNDNNSLVKITDELDFSNTDTLTYIQNVANAQGYFVCVFDLVVPAGRYIATLGRHNVASSGDYRNTSTYITGIADSRLKSQTIVGINSVITTIKTNTNAIIDRSKEMEIDCSGGDVDVWGNGRDLFYIYCPYITTQGNNHFRFIEGYLQETPDSPLGVELFPYQLTQTTDDSGTFTDKNGFYFAYTKDQNANVANIEFVCRLNCQYPFIFQDPTNQAGSGWRPNAPAYISDHNNGVVGDCNRVLLNGKITSLDGTIGYSNISISIKDGETVLTKNDGTFTLIIHNGQQSSRVSNVYINSGGNFLITIADCGNMPITQYNEGLVPCINCQVRTYPIPLNVSVQIQNTSQTSLKEGAKYSIGGVLADLAGRLTFVNVIKDVPVPSFLERQDTLATYFQLLINSALRLNLINPDFKWFCPYVSKNLSESGYIQWIGDSIQYIDNNGNVVSDPSTAVYCSIAIDSLYNYNVSRNFSTLANYQFQVGDRLRILDDGNGNLLTGNPIDLRILGQNYNQAAMTAGLIPSTSPNAIINNNVSSSTQTTVTNGSGATTVTVATTQNNQSITLYVLYDARLTPLIGNTGFWIEIYTPALESEIMPYEESGGFYPIINGEICDFVGYQNGQPLYNYYSQISIDFWDTYLFQRNIAIPNVGDKYFSHIFESPNISDTFGSNITSGGRENVKNDNARQMWYVDEIIKSDDFISQGILNGIGTFRSTNRKTFKDFKSGGIVAVKALRNLVSFICENDFFITDYNYQYIYANAQGVNIANLDNNLGSPHQKIGDAFGCAYEDTGTILFYDKYVFWYDYKNEAFVLMGWGPAVDITKFDPSKGTEGYVSSYFIKKTQFIKDWNSERPNNTLFDVISGVDYQRNNVYITFRPRRNDSNNPLSFLNKRRNTDIEQQETIVFNLGSKRFTRFASFTPEGYAVCKGPKTGLELISFAAGVPYVHNNISNKLFSMFYGQPVVPFFIGVFNENKDIIKVLQNISVDSVYGGYWIDDITSDENGTFSYIPFNFFSKKENQYYAPVLRNMSSYPQINFPDDNLYRSTLTDSAGKRVFGRYFICRFIYSPDNPGGYSELQAVYYLYTASESIKK